MMIPNTKLSAPTFKGTVVRNAYANGIANLLGGD
jgi:hypothetical protein